MSSLDSLETKFYARTGVTLQKGTDGPIAIRLRYIGTGTVTSVTVVTATSIAMITSDGGTDTYLFATYTTIGALADAINSDGIFEAKVLDALRSLASDDFLLAASPITAGTDENGVRVWDVVTDTSASLQIAVCLSAHRNFDYPNGHRTKLLQAVYSVNMGTAAADSFQIWRRRGTVETQVFGALSVDTTETTLTFASGEGFLSGYPDDEFIVLVKDAATLADAAGNFVRVVGFIE